MKKYAVVAVVIVGVVVGLMVGYAVAASRPAPVRDSDKIGMTQFEIRDTQGFPNAGTITHVPWSAFLPDADIYGSEFKPHCQKIVVDKYSRDGWNQYLLYEETADGQKKDIVGVLTLREHPQNQPTGGDVQ